MGGCASKPKTKEDSPKRRLVNSAPETPRQPTSKDLSSGTVSYDQTNRKAHPVHNEQDLRTDEEKLYNGENNRIKEKSILLFNSENSKIEELNRLLLNTDPAQFEKYSLEENHAQTLHGFQTIEEEDDITFSSKRSASIIEEIKFSNQSLNIKEQINALQNLEKMIEEDISQKESDLKLLFHIHYIVQYNNIIPHERQVIFQRVPRS